MQIWAVANQKGGVGKTTTTVALAGLAANAGRRVLVLDLDPHGSLTCYFRLNPDQLPHSTYTLFQERKNLDVNLVGQLIVTTEYQGLSLLPATTGLATLERQAIGNDGMGLVVSKALSQVWEDFDLAILDCPPQLGVLMINALAACQKLIIPVQTEFLALQGLERILRTLQMMQRSRSRPLPFVVVPTMFDRRTQASITSLRTLRNSHGNNVWPGHIPVDTKLRDASKMGIPPHLFSPDSRGVEAYTRLFDYLTAGK
ncbi:ParA family protein [Saccharophagus sp. K07]|uniref:ParA family protein n=1 Tax=Saccharophagus sp. K07 TaxID=2283636 RepID=UPI0016524B21|nr:ParA family protein [Saccharophagus sp. K07]MBC6907139.1 ParA family protein [Saccharophagus sp. K07]